MSHLKRLEIAWPSIYEDVFWLAITFYPVSYRGLLIYISIFVSARKISTEIAFLFYNYLFFFFFFFCEILDTTEIGSGRDPNSQPSDLWANHQAILPRNAAQFQPLLQASLVNPWMSACWHLDNQC